MAWFCSSVALFCILHQSTAGFQVRSRSRSRSPGRRRSRSRSPARTTRRSSSRTAAAVAAAAITDSAVSSRRDTRFRDAEVSPLVSSFCYFLSQLRRAFHQKEYIFACQQKLKQLKLPLFLKKVKLHFLTSQSNVLIHQYLVFLAKCEHNTDAFPSCCLFLFVSINLPPLFGGQQQTKTAENNSNNRHEKKEDKQKEENNTSNKVNEVSIILEFEETVHLSVKVWRA